MKIKVMRASEIEVDAIRLVLPVRYGTEDIPKDFPLRVGDAWRGTIDIASGRIREWPQGQAGSMFMKVCDMGIYTLLNGDEEVGCINEDYVPNSIIPGEYGDYVDFAIDEAGHIAGWEPRPEDVAKAFFGKDAEVD